MANLFGGCDCRKIRYELLEKPMFVNCCNCTWCQRETGSAFVINGVIESANIKHHGAIPDCKTIPSNSKKGQIIHFCPDCKVTLYSNYAGAGPILSFVRIGTLDNPNECPPNAIIFTSTKQDWVCFPDDIPQFEEYYDMKQLYSAQSLARRFALKPQIDAWKAQN
jgi:hypothetical protein